MEEVLKVICSPIFWLFDLIFSLMSDKKERKYGYYCLLAIVVLFLAIILYYWLKSA